MLMAGITRARAQAHSPTIVVIAVAFAVACQPPTFYDSNASNPPEGNDPNLNLLTASETRSIYFRAGDEDRVLTVYNDESGWYDTNSAGALFPKSRPSLAGLSITHNAGIDWIRHGPIQAELSNCGDPLCATRLDGDPWIATNDQRILYTNIALTQTSQAAVAVTKSDNGGTTWSPWKVVGADQGVDHPSVAMRASTALGVYRLHLQGYALLRTFTSDDTGDTWAGPSDLPTFDPFSEFRDETNAQVALQVTQRGHIFGVFSGYVAYTSRAVPSTTGKYDLRIVRISRADLFSAQWQVDSVHAFRAPDQIIDPEALGALGRLWRDHDPIAFTANGVHLYVAWRGTGASGREQLSTVFLADCVDSPAGRCRFQNGSNLNWRVQNFGFPGRGGQYQPSLDVRGSIVALSFYERRTTNNDPATDVVGVFSENGGTTFSSRINLRPEGGNPDPCVYVNPLDPNAPGYFGDYESSVILPLRYPVAPGQSLPWVVSAFADSKLGCMPIGNEGSIFEQHVRATVW